MSKNKEKIINVLIKNMDNNCNNFKNVINIRIGQNIELFITDIIVYKGLITKYNINKIKKCISHGYRYNIK